MADRETEFAEVQKIISDPAHSSHEAWRRGNPELKARGDRAFQAKYGGEEVDPNDVLKPRNAEGSDFARELAEGKGSGPEGDQVMQSLQAEWGGQFQENYDDVARWVYTTFKGQEDLLQRLGEAIGDDVKAANLALSIARQLR